MKGKFIEIDGKVFDLDNPEEKKAAVRAWLEAKSREKAARESQSKPDHNPSHEPRNTG